MFAKEVVQGDPSNPSNIFHWDLISLNLPSSPSYDPSKPWVAKLRISDSLIACDLIIYVDDERTIGNSFQE